MKTYLLAGAALTAAAMSVGTASAATLSISETADFGDRDFFATSVGLWLSEQTASSGR